MKASTTTSSRMETFLISIFVTAGKKKTYIHTLLFIIPTYMCYVIKVSSGLQERVQLSPSVQSMGDNLGCRQDIDLFSIYPGRGFMFYISGQISSPQFYLFIALSLVETYRDIIIDR